MSESSGFFHELARRNVYRAGLGYVVAALALWGGVEVASDAFGWSDAVLRMVIVVSVAGLPVVLAASWLFDVRFEWSSRLGRAVILVVGVLAGGLLGAGLVSSGAVRSGVAGLDSTLRYRLALSPDAPLRAVANRRPRIALSPDGQSLLYQGPSDDGGHRLWLLSRDELEARSLVGTENSSNPVFSPDGTRLAFSRTTEGGQEVVVAPIDALGSARSYRSPRIGLDGLTWGDDGWLYLDGLTGVTDRGLIRMRAEVGEPELVTRLDTLGGETDHVWPHALPGARGVLFTIVRDVDLSDADIAVADPGDGSYRVLVRGVAAKFAPPDHLLYVTADGRLMARTMDLRRRTVSGDEVQVAEGVSVRLNGMVDLAVSRNGRVVYTTGSASSGGLELVRVDRDGRPEPFRGVSTDRILGIAAAPTGDRVAIVSSALVNRGDSELRVQALDGTPPVRLTTHRGLNDMPAWSPDGERVLFRTGRTPDNSVFARRADGLGEPEPVLSEPGRVFHRVRYSPDGRWRLHVESPAGGGRATLTTWATPVDRDGPPVRIPSGLGLANAVTLGSVSPDGRWLAYTESPSGEPTDAEIVVRSFPDTEAFRLTVSLDGGLRPMWSDDGTELFYLGLSGDMIAAQLALDPTPRVTGRTTLFPVTGTYVGFPWVIDRLPGDGRFLMVRLSSAFEEENELVVIEGLTERLRRAAAR